MRAFDRQVVRALLPPVALAAVTVVAICHFPSRAQETPKLDSFFAHLAQEYEGGGETATKTLAESRGLRLRRDQRGELLVPQILEPHPGTAAQRINAAKVQALGGQVDAVSRSFLRALVPFRHLRSLAQHPDVRLVRPPTLAKADYGTYLSESVALTGAKDWHTAGITGAGVRVAVVDLGFIGLTDAIAAGELPRDTIRVKGNQEGANIEYGTAHGVGVAEHVLDMAPGVTLYAILVEDEVDLQNAADYIRDRGIQIANHSVGWVNASYYDDTGPINGIINYSRDKDGVFWAVAAGNDAQRHWRGAWSDPDKDKWLNFAPTDERMNLTSASGTSNIFLNWNQYGNSVTDLDLYVRDKKTSSSLKALAGRRAPRTRRKRWASSTTPGGRPTTFRSTAMPAPLLAWT